jgi:hypothetical protein
MASSATQTAFFEGDFVEILGPDTRAGQCGYVGREISPGDRLKIYVESYGPAEDQVSEPLPCFQIPTSCIKLIRKADIPFAIRVCDYMSGEFPCLGAIALSSEPITSAFHPDSPHGKLPRPTAQDLPGPHSEDCIFNTKESEASKLISFVRMQMYFWTSAPSQLHPDISIKAILSPRVCILFI